MFVAMKAAPPDSTFLFRRSAAMDAERPKTAFPRGSGNKQKWGRFFVFATHMTLLRSLVLTVQRERRDGFELDQRLLGKAQGAPPF